MNCKRRATAGSLDLESGIWFSRDATHIPAPHSDAIIPHWRTLQVRKRERRLWHRIGLLFVEGSATLLRLIATIDVNPESWPRTTTGGLIMHARVKRHVLVMALLTGLFALRVAGQAVQFWMPRSFLPAFDAFQGSNLGYSTLLLIQLLILSLMLRTCLRVGTGISVPNRRFGHGLAWFGGIYMAGSLARIVIGTLVPSAAAWFSAWIPAIFHLVLAGFVLTIAHFHLRYSQRADQQ
jgi:hypothetical protein